MLALWYFIAPQGLIVKNSIVYFDVSPLLLLILTVFCYFLIRLIQRFTGRQTPKNLFYPIQIEWKGKEVACVAKVDIGNSLVEPFSGEPVAVVEKSRLEKFLPEIRAEGKVRLVPFSAVPGGGMLEAFRPDALYIVREKQRYRIPFGYIAICETPLGGFDALLNPDLLENGERTA